MNSIACVYHNHFVRAYKRNALIIRDRLQTKNVILSKRQEMFTFFFINLEIRSEDSSEFHTNGRKNHIHITSKCQGSQGETKKEGAMMAAGKLGRW